jgi:hypothetical protein
MTELRPRCGHMWHTETSGGPHPGYDSVTHWHVCVRPPGRHGPSEHLCECGQTAPQETPAVA